MAIQGRARKSPMPRHQPTNAGFLMSLARSGGGTQTRGPTVTEQIKQKHDWLKDAYVFMKNNRDYLDDPDVRAVLIEKLTKAGFSPIFQPRPDERQAVDMGDGMTGQIAGPGGGNPQPIMDAEKTIHALYQRFAMNHKELFQPYEEETVQGGVPGTQRIEPISGKSRFFQQPYQTVSPDQEIVQWTDMGPQKVYKGEQTFAPTDKTTYGDIFYESQTGRWGQKSSTGEFKPITTGDELAARHKGAGNDDIPNSVWNNNLNNAIKDAIDAQATEKKKRWLGKKIWDGIFGTDDSAFVEHIKPRLDKYNEYYRNENRKKKPPTAPTTTQRKPGETIDDYLARTRGK